MANISEARGTIELDGDWQPLELKYLTYVFISVSSFHSGDYFFDIEGDDFEDMYRAVKELSIGFYGSGRWSFTANLEYMNNWSKLEYSHNFNDICNNKFFNESNKITQEQYVEIRKELFKIMYEKGLKILWHFYDYEGGVPFLYEGEGYHYVNKDNELVYITTTEEYFEPNLKSYCKIFMEGDNEPLYNVLADFKSYFKLTDNQTDLLEKFITDHETWYNLYPYYYVDSDTKINEILFNYIKKELLI